MIIGVGIDLVEIARVQRMLRDRGDRVITRLFTEREAAYAALRVEPARHFAARLAAKEAAYKALAGNDLARAVGWREIEVVNESDGRPLLLLHGRAEARATELRIVRRWLTLTHSQTAAAAVVVLEGE